MASKYTQIYKESTESTGFFFPGKPSTMRRIFILKEEFVTVNRTRSLIRLHARAVKHANEYGRLSKDRNVQSKALRHLRKAERLFCRVSDLIGECTRVMV
jgi:hypothetical protein